MKYQCKFYGGGDTEYDGGIWEKKETLKKIILNCVKKSYFGKYENLEICKDSKKNKHPIRDWSDGSFTVYPNQSGTPYVFEPIKL
jgi:hypothetical protein